MKIENIGLAKETESPENPQGLEKRVALVPKDVEALVSSGCSVFFERGAGEGIGFSNSEYLEAGAVLQEAGEIYKNKDMVLKFKGPSLENIHHMEKGSVLFCMAHFHSFPDRAQLLQKQKINVIAMEEIYESPKVFSDEIILSKWFVQKTLDAQNIEPESMNIGFLGFHSELIGGIRRAGNRSPNSLTIYQEDILESELLKFGKEALYFYDSRHFRNEALIGSLKKKDCQVFDLCEFEKSRGQKVIREYRESHPPYLLGFRKIQCLKETGMAGARYGFRLLKEISPKKRSAKEAVALVLGYGNVAMGAIEEMHQQGVRAIHVLTRNTTHSARIAAFLKKADLVVNGAEQPQALRGKNFLVTSEHVEKVLPKGAVVIDLIGGSPTNRSPVEDVLSCTFLTEPYFEKNGVFVSALWGWPMMGLQLESATSYSQQIANVLMKSDSLLEGLGALSKSVKPALVCGPFVK